MQDKVTKEFQIREYDLPTLKNELKKFNIETFPINGGLQFSIQKSNKVYNIEVYIVERFTQEEQLFMLNVYPHVRSFQEMQMKLFNKVIWN